MNQYLQKGVICPQAETGQCNMDYVNWPSILHFVFLTCIPNLHAPGHKYEEY